MRLNNKVIKNKALRNQINNTLFFLTLVNKKKLTSIVFVVSSVSKESHTSSTIFQMRKLVLILLVFNLSFKIMLFEYFLQT